MKVTCRDISDFYPTINTYLRSIRDIHDDDRLLEKCYVSVWMRDFDADAVASYAFNLPAVAFKEQNSLFRQRAIETMELFSQQISLQPIFLYAHIGQGKTTYLKHLTKIRIYTDKMLINLSKRVYFFYLEYTKSDTDCKAIRDDLEEELEKVIDRIYGEHDFKNDYETLGEIFYAEKSKYERNRGGKAATLEGLQRYLSDRYDADKFFYYRRVVKWLHKIKQIKVCCVLDNVDRHISHFASEKKVINLFQDINSCFIQIIFPLRVSNRGLQHNDYFNIYSPIPITLGLPDYGMIIKSRLDHIESYLVETLGSPIWKIPPIGENEEDSYLHCTEVIDKLKSISNLIGSNEQVRHSMELLSNYVTREYLDIMINLFSSAPLYRHPLTGKKIDYVWRLSEGKFHSLFIYSLMLRNNDIFREDDRGIPIVNVFNNYTTGKWNVFVRFYLLTVLSELGDGITTVGKLTGDLYVKYGIPDVCVLRALKVLCRKQCVAIDTPEHIEPESAVEAIQEHNTNVILSPRGQYHLELTREIEYYEILAIPRFYRKSGSYLEASMSERGRNLRGYLKELEEAERKVLAGAKHIKPLWSEEVLPHLRKEYERVFNRAKAES